MSYILKKSPPSLQIHVGKQAKQIILQQGLNAAQVDVIPGAAGGPKGIGIQGLDQAIFGEFLPQAQKKRLLIGSSIGSWRFASIAAWGAVKGSQKLAELYTHLKFHAKMSKQEVGEVCRQMLQQLIQGKEQQIIDHPDYLLAVLSVKSRHLFASDHPLPLATAILGVIGGNSIARSHLKHFMQRVVAQSPSHQPFHIPIAHDHFKTCYYELSPSNLEQWLMASASIPFVIPAVRNIPAAEPGAYRDGGLIDYHIDLPFGRDGLVLYPHFSNRITPGWFDKSFKKRHCSPDYHARTVLISPSASYLQSLPLGRLPDRKDFSLKGLSDSERIRLWTQNIAESKRLGDEFMELVHRQQFADVMQDLY